MLKYRISRMHRVKKKNKQNRHCSPPPHHPPPNPSALKQLWWMTSLLGDRGNLPWDALRQNLIISLPSSKMYAGFWVLLTKSKFCSVAFKALHRLAPDHVRGSSSISHLQALYIPFRLECLLFCRYTPMLFHFMLLLITFSLPKNSFPPSWNLMLCTKDFITRLLLGTMRVSYKEIVQDVCKDLA